jgi:catechol 2,3-dioxygenase-like lactoylglutathione lyase family enzyme
MLALSTTQLWVHDQDEALTFWTDKVGLEVKEDVTVAEMGNFRWLTVVWVPETLQMSCDSEDVGEPRSGGSDPSCD